MMSSFVMHSYTRLIKQAYNAITLSLVLFTPFANAAFDPVNDDTDIFLANPNVDAQRPNVLIILDNTANWDRNVGGQSININELAALNTVVSNLSDQFNVGLAMYPETGAGNDSIDGAYIRSHVRQMTTQNKTVLANIVSGLDGNGDKGNNNTIALAMLEAYRYFAGKVSNASHGKAKTDFTSNTALPHPATTAGLASFALPTTPDATSKFNSPVTDACQSNFIIYISNGTANENAASLDISNAELLSLGFDTSTTISVSPSGQQGNWMDEWAKYMANADVADPTNGGVAIDGVQNVTTYVVEVDPQTTGQNDDMTALMKSVALNGNGDYFAVTSTNGGQSIVNALNKIFTEIQAVNSVFASTTLPVSVNVRGTNLNQVYIGVFRPDGVKSPRWFGNLKMYNLAFDTSTSTLFLADALGNSAENPTTGFINSNAPSFWTFPSSFWSYRTTEENGTGGSSDNPDGDLVEKGGGAQQLRTTFAISQAARKMYTCNVGCDIGDSLSDTPFATTNTPIDGPALGLGTTAVSNLTAFATQNVTALSDTITVDAMSTAATGFFAATDNGAVNKTVSALTATQIKSLTSLINDVNSITITNLANGSGATKKTITATAAGHGFITGDTVTITGSTEPTFNGTVTVVTANLNTFTYITTGNPANNTVDSSGNATIITTTTIVTASLVNHGFADGQSVTISGVVPTDYNGIYTISAIGAGAADAFSFTVSAGLSPITDDSGATATGDGTTAVATVPAHGYANGSSVTIDGADNPDFNGPFTITSVPDANTFTYDITENGGSRTGVATGTIIASQGSTTIRVTTGAFNHGFVLAQNISVSGAIPSGYNGTFAVTAVNSTTEFEYTTATALPANTSGSTVVTGGTSTTVIASIPNHGLGAPSSNVNLIIEGITNFPAAYNGSVSAFIIDANSIRYTTQDFTAPGPAIGTITARRNTVFVTPVATITGHGYVTGNVVTIRNAANSDYNVDNVAITVIDTDRFSYITATVNPAPGSGGIGEDGSNTIISSLKTTTARVRVVNHGFTTGNTITMAGATPIAFNRTIAVTVLDVNSFTYPLLTAQGDAVGSITASSGAAAAGARDNIINWVRGMDNIQDENGNSVTTDVRASIHGDVLHSRPAVVNYNRHGSNFPNGPDGINGNADDNTTDDDVYIFYGGNDGVFRAVKGGFIQSDVTEPQPGNEAWSFVMEEHFPQLQRLRNNAPTISSSNKKEYFADGTIGTFADDANNDRKLQIDLTEADCLTFPKGPNCDRVYIYISMRRGGRFVYALDITNPADPKLLWKKSSSDTGFGELGYTWSSPQVTTLNIDVTDGVLGTDDSIDNPVEKLVIIMGAGYDPNVEDLDPASITAINSTTGVPTSSGVPFARTMGRGLFILDAETGAILWQTGPPNPTPTPSHTYVVANDMDYAMPSDAAVITARASGVDDRAYIGDTGGNMWRIDFGDPSVANWTVSKLASIADHTTLTGGILKGNRKFLFPPDVVFSEEGFDAVLLGSGDREHPFDTAIVNRFYMFKDEGIGTTATTTDLDEGDLFDTTSNCLQDSSACIGSGDEADQGTALNAINSADGWLLTFGTGEKSVGNAVTLNNVTFFNSNQPSTAVQTSDCSSDLGIARQYRVRFDNAQAILDQNISGTIDAADRAEIHAGGGYLPSPVPIVVEIDGQIYEGVISGVAVEQPPGTTLNARTRKFWFKQID